MSLQPATDSFRSDVSVRQEVIPDAGIGCGVGLLEGCVHFHVHSLWVGGPSGGPGAGAQSFERCLRLAGVTTGGLGSSPEPKAGVFVGLGVRYQLRQAGSGVVRWVWRAVAVMAAAKTRGSMPRATAAAVHASAYLRSPSPATRRRPRRPPERGARAQPSVRTGRPSPPRHSLGPQLAPALGGQTSGWRRTGMSAVHGHQNAWGFKYFSGTMTPCPVRPSRGQP